MARGDKESPEIVSKDSIGLLESLFGRRRRLLAFAFVAIDKDGNMTYAKSAMTKKQHAVLREHLGKMFEVTVLGQGLK